MAATDGTEEGHSENAPSRRDESLPAPETCLSNHRSTNVPAQLGRYRIKRRLGGGGMGAVYLVENVELQRDEALKVPHFESGNDPVIRERFLREARAAARLHHPNLCPIYHADEIDGVCFLTMRYLDGEPLSAYTGRPHSPRQAVKVVAKLAEALEHAHGLGVIHRDLKPANIMMCPGAGPTVLDFGLAKQTRQSGKKLTLPGTMMGTPSYMSPEQVKGDPDGIGPPADVYSLGVILFELLTGEVPFAGSAGEVLGRIIFDETPPPSRLRPELSPELDAVCGKAMAKEPEQRYASMKEFGTALASLLRTLPESDDTGADNLHDGTEEAGNLFERPTVPPDQPAPLNRSHGEIPQRTPALPTWGKTGPYEPKAPEPDGERREVNTRSPVPPSRWSRPPRRWLRAVWLCLALLLASGAAGVFFFVVGPGRDRGASATAEKEGDNEQIAAAPEGPPTEFINEIGMKLVRIPPGKFKMGSPVDEEGHQNTEKQHDVEITRPFWMGVYEVTQKQFREVMGYNPSHFSPNAKGREKLKFPYRHEPGGGRDRIPKGDDSEDYPVENVIWGEGVGFCDRLTARDKKKPASWEYRLPTEAEWEYACRAGSPTYTVFHFGNSLSSRQANFNGKLPYGGAEVGAWLERPCKVGSYEKNAFGLYDMHGNVAEWCLDRHVGDYYRVSPLQDPMGPPAGGAMGKEIRGGTWKTSGALCRSAARSWGQTAYKGSSVGFRVALVPPRK